MQRICLSVFLVFIGLATFAQTTQWRGPNRDGHFNDSSLLKIWPEDGPEQILEVEGIGKGYSSPVLADHIIYISGMIDTLDYVSAITLDGTIKWQKPYGRSWYKTFPDTRATPLVDGNRIYVMSGMGQLSCINKEDGNTIWSAEVDKTFDTEYHRWGGSETPLVVDDLVVVSPGGKKASIVAYNKTSGEPVWQTRPFEGTRSYASATVYEWNGHRFILAVIGTHLLAIKPESGEIVWTYRWHDPEKWNQPGLIWTNTPTYHENNIFLTMGYDYPAVMLEMDSLGTRVTEKFRDNTLDNHHHGVVYCDGHVYGSNWYNNKKGRWVCMKWDTGEIKYVAPWDVKGSMVMADGLLYCYNEKGNVGIVEPDPDGFEIISQFKITKGAGPHWAHPFIGDGKLLIRHGDVLMVYDIKEKK